MLRIAIAAITVLTLSACAETAATSKPSAAMGPGMGSGMMKGQDGGKMGGMADMCAKMMSEKSAAKGDPKANEKMAAMMDNMKGCQMMSGAGGQKPGTPQTAPGKPTDSDDHSDHHPPQ